MRSGGHQLPLISPALSVSACALYFLRTPILPKTFKGPLSASADSLAAATLPSYCAPVRHLDFGTTPQGCVRDGEVRGGVNWTGAGHVVTVAREWIQPDGVAALRVGRSLESELADRLGPPVECHYADQLTAREVRWVAADSTGISTGAGTFFTPSAWIYNPMACASRRVRTTSDATGAALSTGHRRIISALRGKLVRDANPLPISWHSTHTRIGATRVIHP